MAAPCLDCPALPGKVNLSPWGLSAEGCVAIVGALKDRDDKFVQVSGNGMNTCSSKSKALCRTLGICVHWEPQHVVAAPKPCMGSLPRGSEGGWFTTPDSGTLIAWL